MQYFVHFESVRSIVNKNNNIFTVVNLFFKALNFRFWLWFSIGVALRVLTTFWTWFRPKQIRDIFQIISVIWDNNKANQNLEHILFIFLHESFVFLVIRWLAGFEKDEATSQLTSSYRTKTKLYPKYRRLFYRKSHHL